MTSFLALSTGERANEHRARHGTRERYAEIAGRSARAELGPSEAAYLRERDSFYLATIGENGWPYVQHRGGPRGFIHVLSPTRIAWVERPGNRQYLTAGNIDAGGRVALIAVDYPARARIKLLGTATYHVDPDPELAALAGSEPFDAIVTVDVAAYDWNCPKHITQRYTLDDVRRLVAPLQARVAELEAQLGERAASVLSEGTASR